MKIYYLSFIISVIFLYSCSKLEEEQSNSNSIITLNIDTIKSAKLNYSSLFESAEIIKLEDCEQCSIGQIRKLKVVNNKIYILDRISNSIFVFNLEGKFIRKVGIIGKGPGEITSASTFDVNETNLEIYILDMYKNILIYDSTGIYKSTLIPNTPKIKDFFVNDDGSLFINTEITIGSVNYILYQIDGIRILSKNLETANFGKDWALPIEWPYQFVKSDSRTLFFQNYLDTIYEVNNGKIKPYLTINSKNVLSNDDLKSLSERTDIVSMSKNFYNVKGLIPFIMFYDNTFYNFIVSKNYGNGVYIIFNKVSRKTHLTNSSEFYDDYYFTSSKFPPFIFAKDDYFIKVIPTSKLHGFKKILDEKKVELSYSFTSNSNPLLIIYKCKNE